MRKLAAFLFLLLACPALLVAQQPSFRGRSIAQWREDLSHPNAVIRAEAAQMLGRLGEHADQAVDPLIAALRDRHPDVRLQAATALGRIQRRTEPCLAALTLLLEDQDEHVRFAAEWSLARIALSVAAEKHSAHNAKTLDTLLAAAERALAQGARNPKHVRQIADARQALRGPAPVAIEPEAGQPPLNADEIAAFRADLQSDDKLAQLKAIARFARLGRAADLIEASRTADEGGFLRWHLTGALVEIGRPAVPVLAQALRDDDETVAWQAAQSLQRMGPAAIEALPHLVAVIEDQDAATDIREAAVRVIESFGPTAVGKDAAADAVATLTRTLLDHDHESLVETSARALAAIGPAARAAEPTLLAILRSDDRTEATRMAAAEALPAITPSSAEVVDTLVALLARDCDPFFAATLASALGRYGDAGAAAVPRLIELIDGTVDFERQEIIRALGNIGPPARQATPRLIACLTDDDEFESVQVTAARTLARFGPQAVRSLADQLDHPHWGVRLTIARALIEIGADAAPAARPLELRLRDRDELPEIQALAVVALGQIGRAAASTAPLLADIMGDANQPVSLRAMSAVSIGQIDPARSPTLVAALGDPRAELRVAAAYALQRLPTPHPDALPALIRELEHDDGRQLAMRALGEFKTASRPLLTEVVNDRAKDEPTRVASLNLIGELGMTAAPQLLEALNDETLAESAYWNLRDLGNATIPLLISAADNKNEFTDDARAAVHELVEDLYGGIGGGEGDAAWTGGHALVDRIVGQTGAAARMATAAPDRENTGAPGGGEAAMATEPEEIMPPQPVPAATAGNPADLQPPAPMLAVPPTAPETGYESVKVFYGTNRQPTDDGKPRRLSLPWYLWLLIAASLGGILVWVVKQFRRGNTGRGIAGVAGIILLSVAVETAVRRIQQVDQALGKQGPIYGTQYSTEVKLGVCEVTIPKNHQEGELERPGILRLQVVEDPEQHIILKRVQPLDPDVFFAELQSELGQRGNSILVFIHGYNVSFESAARRTAQMSHDLKFAGAPVFYSWPSQANWRKYRVDEKNVELSVNQLKAFLLDITRRSGADTVNLIAHSMGNRALTSALKEIEVASTEQEKLFNQVILAAPDIDADVFRERIAPKIVDKARHITLYASSKDLALVASREFNSGDPRAGDAGEHLVVVPGIETIDVSAGESSLLGHSYYGDSASVLRDIEFLLQDKPAAERAFLEPFPRIDPTHWLFQPAAVARRADATNERR